MTRMEVQKVVLNLTTYSPVVILGDGKGHILPIVIGLFEAQAILLVLEKVNVERPLTHDLLKRCIEVTGGRLTRLDIYMLKDSVYFANLIVEHGGVLSTVDCRPSDGIVLALKFSVPIFCREDLLEDEDVIQYYTGKDFLASPRLNRPIDKRELDEFRKVLDSTSSQEFWRKLREEREK